METELDRDVLKEFNLTEDQLDMAEYCFNSLERNIALSIMWYNTDNKKQLLEHMLCVDLFNNLHKEVGESKMVEILDILSENLE